MNTLPASAAVVNLHADEWDARAVGQFAAFALRQPGNIAELTDDLQARPCKTFSSNGQRRDNTRIWVIEDSSGNVLAEESSLYKAIHKLAR
jgi:hypothetical protein